MDMEKEPGVDGSTGEDPVVTKVFSSKAPKLVLRGIVGDITIITGAKEISVKVEGKRSRVDALNCVGHGHAYVVAGDAGTQRATTTQRITAGGSAAGSRGGLSWLRRLFGVHIITTIVTTESPEPVNIVLHVPNATDVTIDGIIGEVRAPSAVLGCVKAEVPHRGHLFLNEVKTFQVRASSNALVDVTSVCEGDLTIDAGHRSVVTIGAGYVDRLAVRAGSNANVKFSGVAEDAVIEAAHRAEVDIARLFGNVEVNASSNAAVLVHSGELNKLRLSVGHRSRAALLCTVTSADVEAGSSSLCGLGGIRESLRGDLRHLAGLELAWGDLPSVSVVVGSDALLRVPGTIHKGQLTLRHNATVTAGGYAPELAVSQSVSAKLYTDST